MISLPISAPFSFCPPTAASEAFHPGYFEVVKRLSPEKIEEIEMRILRVPEAEMERGIGALLDDRYPRWLDIFKDPNLPEYAMVALRRGQLSQQRWGSAMYFWGAFDLGLEIQYTVPLVDSKGRIYPALAFDILEILKPLNKVEEFTRRIQALPPSEQLVLLIKRPNTWTTDGIRNAGENVNFNLLNSFAYFVVPAMGVMQTLGDMVCDEGRVKLNAVLGVCSLDIAREVAGKDWSDFLVPHPVKRSPASADFGLVSPGVDYQYHEFYHFVLRCFTERKQRHLNLKASDALLPLIERACKVGRSRFHLLDMENIYFRPEYRAKKKLDTIPKTTVMWLHVSEGLAQASFLQSAGDTLVGAKTIYEFLSGPVAAEAGVSGRLYRTVDS